MKAETKNHPFTYTLGNGPFKYIGSYDLSIFKSGKDFEEIMRHNPPPKLKDGLGTCAHCGHPITHVMIVQNGDNELYGVGSDCVQKVYDSGDVRAISQMQKDIRARKREQRHMRECKKIGELLPEYKKALTYLTLLPHINSYYASKGKTLADYFEFIVPNSAPSTKIKHMKTAIKRAESVR